MPVLQTNCIACGVNLSVTIYSNAGVLCTTCAGQGIFRKQIIITGITRMNYGNICVSGIDPQTWKFVRPIFQSGLQRDFTLENNTQVISHFNLVEIEFRHYRPGHVYHTEDWVINGGFAPRFVRHLTDQEILQVLNKMAVSNLDLAMQPQDKSLFIVKTRQIIKMWHENFEKFKVRITFIDDYGNLHYKVPVTDMLTLAFVQYQLSKKNHDYATEFIKAFNANPRRYIRIGLTREFNGRHWKQVTAIITIPDIFNGRSFSYYENQIGHNV